MSDQPTRIGDYEIEARLGVGGMATVYRARHAVLETQHAIKVLDPRFRANVDARQRFLDEAKIQAKHLDHPHIVKVTNIVATDEHAALVMELIDGTTLEQELATLRTDPAEQKRIMLGILDAVGYAHEQGIIHRDLKPANVLLARKGSLLIPKVTDFGIAKVVLGDATGRSDKKSTHADARMGTLDYMSPEQVRRSKDVTPRSDVFSLGAMLHELATGEVPFAGDSDYDVMENIIHGRPRALAATVDPVIAAVIARALKPDPAERFESCAAMADALRADPSRTPVAVANLARAAALVRPAAIADVSASQRSWLPVAAGGLLAIGGLIALVVALQAKPDRGIPTAASTLPDPSVAAIPQDAPTQVPPPADATPPTSVPDAPPRVHRQPKPVVVKPAVIGPLGPNPLKPNPYLPGATLPFVPMPGGSAARGCDEVSCLVTGYATACCAKHQKVPKPTTPPTVAMTLDTTMVQKGLIAVKPHVMLCADQVAVAGIVNVDVKVDPDGSVLAVTVMATPDAALGSCVAAAMKSAIFAKTKQGGRFQFPFTF